MCTTMYSAVWCDYAKHMVNKTRTKSHEMLCKEAEDKRLEFGKCSMGSKNATNTLPRDPVDKCGDCKKPIKGAAV